MGRGYVPLIHRQSSNSISITSSTRNLATGQEQAINSSNNILSSFNLVQHFHKFLRRKPSFDKVSITFDQPQTEKKEKPKETTRRGDKVFKEFEDWNRIFDIKNIDISISMAVAGVGAGSTRMDLSNVKILQTLNLSKGDVNSVAFGRNFMLATGSG